MNMNVWFGILELPFLVLCIIFAFLTANALKGGAFGRGMALLAWGFLVMGIGHLHMQLQTAFHFNLIEKVFGSTGANVAWFVALAATWALSGLGFFSIYKASTSG